MQELDIKRGHFKNIDGRKLEDIMGKLFGKVDKDGERLVSNFGAMKPIVVWIKDKKTICVDINTTTEVDDQTITDSLRARNSFLQEATGFTSKERSKRLQKKAKEGKM